MIIGKKQLIVILIISIFALLFSIGIVAANSYLCRNYVPTEATIVDVSTDRGATASVGRSRSNIVTYQFNIRGENIIASKQVFNKGGKNIGDKETIKYDPLNSTKIENTLVKNTGITLSIFFIVFAGMLIKIIISKR